jgi:hypothetical protein
MQKEMLAASLHLVDYPDAVGLFGCNSNHVTNWTAITCSMSGHQKDQIYSTVHQRLLFYWR